MALLLTDHSVQHLSVRQQPTVKPCRIMYLLCCMKGVYTPTDAAAQDLDVNLDERQPNNQLETSYLHVPFLQVKDEGSGYHYNAVHRWYYDAASGMYYGGEPPEWTKVPDIPKDAKYETMAAPSNSDGNYTYQFMRQCAA